MSVSRPPVSRQLETHSRRIARVQWLFPIIWENHWDFQDNSVLFSYILYSCRKWSLPVMTTFQECKKVQAPKLSQRVSSSFW